MPAVRLTRAFTLFWWTLGAVIFYLAVHTVGDALAAGHRDLHALAVGALEAVAAVLFLVPRTMRAGALGLLGIFTLAFVIHLAQGQFAASLLVYAAGVYFVLVHGAVPLVPRAARPLP